MPDVEQNWERTRANDSRLSIHAGADFPLPLDSHGIEQQFYSDIALCQVCFCVGQNDAKLMGKKRPVK
jgi:hypothetical protein